MYNAELYNQSNSVHKRDIPKYLEKYVPKMKFKKSNTNIIDIGSGDGSITTILQRFLPPDSKILGCDISENMVRFATNHYSNEHISFTKMDISDCMPEEMKGTFDHAFSFYVLNWVIDQKRAFQNIFDLLEPDGECFMILTSKNTVFEVYRTLVKNNKWSTWVYDVERYISPYHDSEDSDKDITKLMEYIGFLDVSVKSIDNFFLFPDECARKNLMEAISPFQIPKDKNDEFMKDYIQVMDDIESVLKIDTNHSPNDVTFHYTSVLIYGRKPLATERQSE